MTTSTHHSTDNTIIQLYIPSIRCGSCVTRIEKALQKLPGIISTSVNLSTKIATLNTSVSFQPNNAYDALIAIGNPAESVDNDELLNEKQEHQNKKQSKRYIFNAILALLLAVPLMLLDITHHSVYTNTLSERLLWLAIGTLTLGVMALTGKQFYWGMLQSARHGRATMDTLVSLSTSIAWLYSMLVVSWPSIIPTTEQHLYFEAAAMILGFINIGQALELKAKGKASTAIQHLTNRQTKNAIKIVNNQDIEVAYSSIMTGDTLRVKPGTLVPADGNIIEGNSTIDESMLTGESIPVKKGPKSYVAAGTLNNHGSFIMIARYVGRDTQLGQIVSAVKQAQASKIPIAKIVDKISGIFVPIVIALAIIAALVWYFVGPEPTTTYMLMSAMAVLIIACPCALGLATPVALMHAMGKAAEYGLLIKNGEALQTASQIDTLVLDKTGTLTEGKPKVVQVSTAKNVTEKQLFQLAYSLEAHSEHPLSNAIIEKAKSMGVNPLSTDHFEVLLGYGLKATIQGKTYLLGNDQLMRKYEVDLSPIDSMHLNAAMQTHTLVFLAEISEHNQWCLGVMGISDTLRKDAKQAIKRLQKLGIDTVMLTGDHYSVTHIK